MRGGIAESQGDYDAALTYFKVAYAKNPDAYMVAHDISCCYSMKSDKENCIVWLKKALATSYSASARKWAKTDAAFNNVRDSDEFKALITDP